MKSNVLFVKSVHVIGQNVHDLYMAVRHNHMGLNSVGRQMLPLLLTYDHIRLTSFHQGHLIQWARWARAQGPQPPGGPRAAEVVIFS